MLQQLGPYRIERLLGRGGMGAVYAGTHEATGERVAIKALAIPLADDRNFRARFLVEIETLKQLRHPNIVRMIGDGEQDGMLFYAMELVEGQSLQDVLQSGRYFTWQEVVRIAIDVSGALKHAHDCGIIHRDLKPANLLRTPEGRIKLSDFGIAKLFGATHRTADGSVVGTADYMAPEQADGRPVTNRSDLYSLGAVMFTLLARRTPFAGGSLPQVIHKLKFEPAPLVRRFSPDVPEELETIIAELLRKDPQERIPTALVLANRLRALEHALANRGEEELPPHQAKTQVAAEPPHWNDKTVDTAAPLVPPATSISPTREDRPHESLPADYSWNDATVMTSGSQPEGAANTSPPNSAVTAVSPGERRNRFTTIEEHRERQTALPAAEPGTAESPWGTIGLAVAVAAIIGLGVWAFWPPSAESLYKRIRAAHEQDRIADVVREIDQFLERFPQDARSAEVGGYRSDVEADWLASRLSLRKLRSDGHGLEDYEARWLDAYRRRVKEPDEARQAFEGILAEFGTQPATDPLQAVLAATRHLLKQLEAVPPPAAN